MHLNLTVAVTMSSKRIHIYIIVVITVLSIVGCTGCSETKDGTAGDAGLAGFEQRMRVADSLFLVKNARIF